MRTIFIKCQFFVSHHLRLAIFSLASENISSLFYVHLIFYFIIFIVFSSFLLLNVFYFLLFHTSVDTKIYSFFFFIKTFSYNLFFMPLHIDSKTQLQCRWCFLKLFIKTSLKLNPDKFLKLNVFNLITL